MTFEISARGLSCFPWPVNFGSFFSAACSKVFREASLSFINEQVSRFKQSLPSSNMLPYFVSSKILAKRMNLGLETERHHIASFDVGGDESLASKSSF